ncbi:MAG: hypothetical protein EOP67_27045, partial [Sphingomonas sp.]
MRGLCFGTWHRSARAIEEPRRSAIDANAARHVPIRSWGALHVGQCCGAVTKWTTFFAPRGLLRRPPAAAPHPYCRQARRACPVGRIPRSPTTETGTAMHIVYYKDAVGNFGDDLNELIWPRVLPDDVRSAPDTVLVGIGSLLDEARFRGVETVGKRVFVMGSGAAYGRLPDDSARWTYCAVRGPLTASVVGHPSAAVTDSAALLANLPDLVPRSARADEILFMPHHRTLVNSNWQAAAERAGMTFVDPQWTPDRILACYGRAKLVVTEAMHGAIVADTLRIPWIPVMISPEVSIFKWRDWA